MVVIATLGYTHITEVGIQTSDTMRAVVAQVAPHLDARLVDATVIYRPVKPLKKTDKGFKDIQKGVISVKMAIIRIDHTFKMPQDPSDSEFIDYVFDIPQRAEDQLLIRYAKERGNVAQAKICEEWVAWTRAMVFFFTLLALFGPERLFELASIAVLVSAVLAIVALWFKDYFDWKGKGRSFPDIRTATSGLLYSTPIDIIDGYAALN